MEKLTLNELGKRAFENAKAKGFHENPLNIPTRLMLIVSEISEAMEADRKNKHADLVTYGEKRDRVGEAENMDLFQAYVKDTFEDELADAVIRVVELAASMGIDLDTHVEMKMRYNATREYKHGKRY